MTCVEFFSFISLVLSLFKLGNDTSPKRPTRVVILYFSVVGYLYTKNVEVLSLMWIISNIIYCIKNSLSDSKTHFMLT